MANKGKRCIRKKRVKGGKMRCAKFGGLSGTSKKGRCLKWSKGRTKCLKRAKK